MESKADTVEILGHHQYTRTDDKQYFVSKLRILHKDVKMSFKFELSEDDRKDLIKTLSESDQYFWCICLGPERDETIDITFDDQKKNKYFIIAGGGRKIVITKELFTMIIDKLKTFFTTNCNPDDYEDWGFNDTDARHYE